MYESLHNHTTTSDGKLSHLEMLKAAEKVGIGVMAFTDHDVLPDEATMEQLRAYTGPVQWTIGIEMSSAYPKDMHVSGSLHVVGLFVDVGHSGLHEHCTKAQDARRERMQRITRNLAEVGIVVTEAECLAASGGESVGRPHTVAAILGRGENNIRMQELREEMANDASVTEEYAAMEVRASVRGEQEYVYSLLLGNDAYFKGIYVDYLYMLDLDETVTLLRGAGGIGILAHQWCYGAKLPLDTVETLLEDGRLDGIETLGGAANESLAAYPALSRLAAKTGCLISMGADAHDAETLERYGALPCIEATKGVYATLQTRVAA